MVVRSDRLLMNKSFLLEGESSAVCFCKNSKYRNLNRRVDLVQAAGRSSIKWDHKEQQ